MQPGGMDDWHESDRTGWPEARLRGCACGRAGSQVSERSRGSPMVWRSGAAWNVLISYHYITEGDNEKSYEYAT